MFYNRIQAENSPLFSLRNQICFVNRQAEGFPPIREEKGIGVDQWQNSIVIVATNQGYPINVNNLKDDLKRLKCIKLRKEGKKGKEGKERE